MIAKEIYLLIRVFSEKCHCFYLEGFIVGTFSNTFLSIFQVLCSSAWLIYMANEKVIKYMAENHQM